MIAIYFAKTGLFKNEVNTSVFNVMHTFSERNMSICISSSLMKKVVIWFYFRLKRLKEGKVVGTAVHQAPKALLSDTYVGSQQAAPSICWCRSCYRTCQSNIFSFSHLGDEENSWINEKSLPIATKTRLCYTDFWVMSQTDYWEMLLTTTNTTTTTLDRLLRNVTDYHYYYYYHFRLINKNFYYYYIQIWSVFRTNNRQN